MSRAVRWSIVKAERGGYDECAECGHLHFDANFGVYTDCPVDECRCEGQAALTRPRTHGGRRAGSGRKPILDNASQHTFHLTPAHLEIIDAWGQQHQLDNRAAALRHLIESNHTLESNS